MPPTEPPRIDTAPDGGEAADPNEGSAPPATLPPELTGARVLLVEDNPINQEVACGLLQILGLEVEVAGDGEQAVARSAWIRYDLILMDVQMPVVDGIEATRLIRAQPERGDVPIIAMTADATPADKERCVAAGMNDHIAKPIGLHTLVPTLSRWLRGEADDPARQPATPAPPEPAAEIAVADADVFDPRLGMKIAAGDPVEFAALMRRFVDFTQTDIDELKRRLDGGQVEESIRRAHSIAGSAAMIGANEVSKLARAMLVRLRAAEPLPEIAPAASDLEASLARLDATVRQLEG